MSNNLKSQVPLHQKIKNAKDKTLVLMNNINEQKSIQSFLDISGQNMPKWDPAHSLSKIPELWKGIFPEKTHIAHPHHKKEETWVGIDFPKEVLEKLKITQKGFKQDLIHVICSAGLEKKASRPALVKLLKWALASGLNPNEYNGRVTGVGLAAYSGQLDFLKILHASGADVCLEIRPQDYTSPLGNPIGSTLLHRLVEREPRYPHYVDLILFLMEVYENPSPVDSQGNTPLSLASPYLSPIIQAKIAQLEGLRLKKLPKASRQNETKRL